MCVVRLGCVLVRVCVGCVCVGFVFVVGVCVWCVWRCDFLFVCVCGVVCVWCGVCVCGGRCVCVVGVCVWS